MLTIKIHFSMYQQDLSPYYFYWTLKSWYFYISFKFFNFRERQLAFEVILPGVRDCAQGLAVEASLPLS